VVSKYSNDGSCGVPIVVVEHAAEALPTADLAVRETYFFSGFDDLSVEALMISFAVIVDEILVDDSLQMCVPEENHPVRSLTFE
jgi:hypothetical protein